MTGQKIGKKRKSNEKQNKQHEQLSHKLQKRTFVHSFQFLQ